MHPHHASTLPDVVLLNRATCIGCCVARVREEFAVAGNSFATNLTRQDAATLNILRACEMAIDMGQHVIRTHKLGLPQSARDVFTLLARGGHIPPELADTMGKMVGFRNLAVHDYQRLLLPVVEKIITQHLDDFLRFTQSLLHRAVAD